MRPPLGPFVLFALLLVVMGWRSLATDQLIDLDAAHHLMDSLFFRDLFVARPADPVAYTFDYYRQYPALGFLFWPPAFPALAGLALLIAGPSLLVVRLCVIAAALTLAVGFFLVMRRAVSGTAAAFAAALLMTTPLLVKYSTQVMLETPVLAAGMLAILAYLALVARPTYRNAAWCAAAGALAVYTKQPIVFLFAAMAFHMVVTDPRMVTSRHLWSATALFAILALPLVAFTLTYGSNTLQQSIGSDASFVLGAAPPPARWTLAAWLFYPSRLIYVLNPVVLVLALGACVYAVRVPAFLRTHAIWFGWLAAWFLLFSYFLNKQERFLVLSMPGWIALAVAAAVELQRRRPVIGRVAMAALAWPLVAGLFNAITLPPAGFTAVEPVVREMLSANTGRNIAYFGQFRQVIVPFVRLLDAERRVHVLQGDDIVDDGGTLADASRDYRVGLVVVELDGSPAAEEIYRAMQHDARFTIQSSVVLPHDRKPVTLGLFRHTGPVAATMTRVPLRSRLVAQRGVEPKVAGGAD